MLIVVRDVKVVIVKRPILIATINEYGYISKKKSKALFVVLWKCIGLCLQCLLNKITSFGIVKFKYF